MEERAPDLTQRMLNELSANDYSQCILFTFLLILPGAILSKPFQRIGALQGHAQFAPRPF